MCLKKEKKRITIIVAYLVVINKWETESDTGNITEVEMQKSQEQLLGGLKRSRSSHLMVLQLLQQKIQVC